MTKQRTCMERGRKTSVRLDQINLESEAGTARPGPLNTEWVKDLARTRRNAGKLDPITLWKNPEAPSAPFIILDGRHRIAAYRALKRVQKIPAEVRECSYREALLISAKLHTNASMPLTAQQKADFTWRLVWEDLGYSKKELTRATGMGLRTIGYMRARRSEMIESEQDFTGRWWTDKKDTTMNDEHEDISDKERNEQMEMAAKDLRDHWDGMKKRYPLMWQREFRSDVMERAHGHLELRNMIDWLGMVDVDEDDEDGFGPIKVSIHPADDPHAIAEEDAEADF